MFILSIILFISSIYLIYKYNSRIRNKLYLSLVMGISFTYFLSCVFYLLSDYFTGKGIDESIWYHLSSGISTELMSQFPFLIAMIILSILLSFIFIYVIYKMLENKKNKKSMKTLLSEILILLSILVHPTIIAIHDLYNVNNEVVEKINFSDFYQKPTIKSIKDNHPNFVYIYIESLERTFLDEKIFPELAINLNKLEKDNYSFTNVEENYGTGWTAAGIVSSQCGIPLIGSDKGYEFFYKNAICLSDLLKTQKYFLSVLQGSSIKFAGLNKFYKTHGFDSIKGKDKLIDKIGFMPPLNKWGLYDDVLLEESFTEFNHLSSKNKNFGLFISTIDTHASYGYQSKSCVNIKYGDGSNPMLNAVKCTDILISNFIKRIKKSEYGDNTIIILSSDHLMMRSVADNLLSKGKRKNLFIIIDPVNKTTKIIDKKASMFDIGPTILHSLGFKSSLGLGRNLFSNENSLSNILIDFDLHIKSWINKINEFWDILEINNNIFIDIKKQKININSKLYQLPVMLKMDNNLRTTMLFDMERTDIVNNFVKSLGIDEVLIWIDKCKRIKETSVSSEYCLIIGKFGNELNSYELSSNKEINLDMLNNYIKQTTTKKHFNYNYNNLQKQIFHIESDTTLYEKVYNLAKEYISPEIRYFLKSTYLNLFKNIKNVFSSEYKIILKENQKLFNQNKKNVERFIAHAAGEIDGYKYTNSLEALNYNYSKGFRLFELDIIKTKDNIYVASHDWKLWSEQTNNKKGITPTLEEFLKNKIYNKFTPLDIDGINNWFLEHSDAILVTDKVNTPLDFSKKFIDKKRLIMELFTWKSVEEGITSNIKSVMPSSTLLLKKDETNNIINKLIQLDITKVALPYGSILGYNSFFKKLKNNKIDAYIFGVNNYEQEDEVFVICNDLHNLYGIYADIWEFPDTINCNN